MKVSVITPSFNQGKFIQRTLQSVRIQSGADIEHTIFDGGSTDETLAILGCFGGGIRWISEKDKGQTDAVNKGICATDGEIIGWLNSDDIYYPGAISRVVAHFDAHPEIDVIYGMADHINLNDVGFEAYPSEPWNFARLKETCFICQPAAFFRRRVVEKYGLLNDRLHYCMDYEYWLRLGKSGVKFAYLEEKLAGSRLYAENKTLGSRVLVHSEINDVHKALFGSVPERWVWNYAQVVVEEKIDRVKYPRRFALSVAIAATIATLKWNKRSLSEMKSHLCYFWRRALDRLPRV